MAVTAWGGEVLRHVDGLVAPHLPGRPIEPALREAILATAAEAAGCRWYASLHGAWRDFLGAPDGLDGADEAILEHARRSGAAGRPQPVDALAEWLAEPALDAVRATTARAGLISDLGAPLDRLVARLGGASGPRARSAVDVGLAALAVPAAVAALAASAAMRAVIRLAPPLPTVRLPDREPNLLAQVLAESVPRYLANAAGRLLVLSSPVPIRIGVRSGRTRATVTVWRGGVSVTNGIDDALVVLDGDVEPVLRVASATVARELRLAARPRPR